jgi:hypothetical protein
LGIRWLIGWRGTGAVVAVALLAGCGGGDAAASGEAELAGMDHHGCGYGFWLGTPEQDLAVRLAVADPGLAEAGDVPREATLPDAAWLATVVVGRDLYANWCDDVLEEGEPEPEPREEWPITAGTITVHDPTPGFTCPTEVAATLTDLVATRPDGSTLELGSGEVTNDTWGCFAG